MKKIGSLLLVSIFAGAITLGAYKLLFEKANFTLISQNDGASVLNTSITPTSPKGAGINEVDFTLAAENTVNAVVHVKNLTLSRWTKQSYGFLFWFKGKLHTASGLGFRSNHYGRWLYCYQ